MTFDNQFKWDNRFLIIAEAISLWSKDRSTKVGAVIVGEHRNILSTGYNGFPRNTYDELFIAEPGKVLPEIEQLSNIEIDKRYNDRPYKYLWAEHAERNAIYNCARHGVSIEGTTIYITPFPPCADCARAIIQSGIKRVVTRQITDKETNKRWEENWHVAKMMFLESGVEIEF